MALWMNMLGHAKVCLKGFRVSKASSCVCTEMQKKMWARLRESRVHQDASHAT